MSSDEAEVTLGEKIQIAVDTAYEGEGIPSRWMLIVEVVDTEMERDLQTFSSDSCAPWDEYGFIRYTLAQLDAFVDHRMLAIELQMNEEEEDE